jgi:hypothetical protein
VTSGRIYISHDVIFYENIFPFTSLSSSAAVCYSADVLRLPTSGARSDSCMNNTLPNANTAPPVLLPFDVLQPQRIPTPSSAPTCGTKNQVDPTEFFVQQHAAPTGPCTRFVWSVVGS